jgi:hypothetical protein
MHVLTTAAGRIVYGVSISMHVLTTAAGRIVYGVSISMHVLTTAAGQSLSSWLGRSTGLGTPRYGTAQYSTVLLYIVVVDYTSDYE